MDGAIKELLRKLRRDLSVREGAYVCLGSKRSELIKKWGACVDEVLEDKGSSLAESSCRLKSLLKEMVNEGDKSFEDEIRCVKMIIKFVDGLRDRDFYEKICLGGF